MGIRLGIGGLKIGQRSGTAAVPFDWSSYWATQGTAELIAYTAGLTTALSTDQLNALTAFVKAIKTGLSISALSDAFDAMYLLAGETSESSLRNLVRDASHCTLVNAPTFTQFEGFVGNGSDQCINTNHNSVTQGIKYTLNNASYGYYCRTDKIETACEMGAEQGKSGRCNTLARYSTDDVQTSINCASGTSSSTAGTDSSGFFIVNRTAADAFSLYRNNNVVISGAVVASTVPNYNWAILAVNDDGTFDSHSTRQVSFAFIGRSLDGLERGVLQDAVEAYMDANGKGVIP